MCFQLCFPFIELAMRPLALLFHWWFFSPVIEMQVYSFGEMPWDPELMVDLLPGGQEEPGAAGAAGSAVWLLWNTEPSVWGPGSRTAGKG